MFDAEETKRVCEAATPGPLRITERIAGGMQWFVCDEEDEIAEFYDRDDAELFVHARTALPEAVAEVVRLKARMAEALRLIDGELRDSDRSYIDSKVSMPAIIEVRKLLGCEEGK